MDDVFLPLLIEDDEDFLLIQLFKKVRQIRPKLHNSFSLVFHLNNFSNDFCLVHFRFHKTDIIRLQRALGIPNKIRCSNRISVCGTEALCILLKRLAYPNRLLDLMSFFCKTECELSRICNWMVRDVTHNYGHLLTNLDQPWLSTNKIEILCMALRAKKCPYHNCFGFLDGTARAICRPKVNLREYYNGHKRVHAVKFQSLLLPNRLIGNRYGPVNGRWHDTHLLQCSDLISKLERKFAPPGKCYHIYADTAYPLKRHLMTPFNSHNLTPSTRKCNKLMSSIRESVEWGFNKIIQLFAFLDFKKNIKVGLQPVGNYYLIGAILTNCHTCLYGSETSYYFSCQPPELEDYIGTK